MRKIPTFLVVGGGVIGASIAYYLSETFPNQVVLCEKSSPPGIGATAMSGGLIRMNHTQFPLIDMSWKSYQVYKEIGSSCGFQQTGFGLIIHKTYAREVEKAVLYMKESGIPVMVLNKKEVSKYNPFLSIGDDEFLVYEPISGFADPKKTALYFINKAKENGLRLYEGTKVDDFIISNGEIVGVRTNIGPLHAKNIILCGNIWTKKLLKQINCSIPLYSKRIGLMFLHSHPSFTKQMLTVIDDTLGTYYRPVFPNRLFVGLKTEQTNHQTPIYDIPNLSEIHQTYDLISKRFPGIKPSQVAGGRISFDSYTPDQFPIVGKIATYQNLFIATGFNGGGFKIAPAIGHWFVSYFTNEQKENHPFNIDRFSSGQVLTRDIAYAHM
ncbi:FAD-binding oxidoreductase [Thermoactinomyces sp. CICC 10521]|uniref:NAD(P)/FAD-dependent oxidoreductase n=1 Tax=Thermoactinomyces sp. CICC 10521 TaxID=2767426 RepID=UPI0018DECE3C|nr:FAD-dependent oxidoreductase [Thermoactinomyces sp. CICC 10521]MBH8608764.1 FAD-binding oxidoreductase [Thermoactinomyces sp. CICC 10521]